MNIIILFLLIYALLIYAFSFEKEETGVDYLIVLGCRLENDEPAKELIERIDRAVLFLKKNPECKVIVSGGITKGNSKSEAEVMYDLLIDRGIEPDRIIKEDQAKDTYENFFYSKKLLEQGKKVCFCSSDYHILRSKLMAMKNRLKTYNICSHSSIKDKIIHLPLEEYFIIQNMIKK